MKKISQSKFICPWDYEEHQRQYAHLTGPYGSLLMVACDAGKSLAINVQREYLNTFAEREDFLRTKKGISVDSIAEKKSIPLFLDITKSFEDGGMDGTCPVIPHNVSGANAYVFQNCMDKRPGRNSVNDNLQQLLQMMFALKIYGAKKVTAIVPYFPYSRQDKPSHKKREVALMNFAAQQMILSGLDDLRCYHPHTTSLVSGSTRDTQFRYISGIDLWVDEFSQFKDDPSTIAVSPDAGGSKELIALAGKLGIGYCSGTKDRPEHTKTVNLGVNEKSLEGKTRAIIVDDETATFNSCFGIIKYLSEKGIKEFHLGLSHMRAGGPKSIHQMIEAHDRYNMVALHTTDSVPQKDELLDLPFMKVHSLAQMWAFVINATHHGMSVSKLFTEESMEEKEEKVA